MKKKYISPVTTVIEMRSQSQLLAGSLKMSFQLGTISDEDDDFEQY